MALFDEKRKEKMEEYRDDDYRGSYESRDNDPGYGGNYDNYDDGSNEDLGFGLKLLSFCIPLVGAILFFVYRPASPRKANAACTAALWGFGIGVIFSIISRVTYGGW